MFLRTIVSLTLLSTTLLANPIQERVLNPEALDELMVNLGLDPSGDVIAQTQEHWLRKPGKERWEMSELPEEEASYVINWAETQGLYAPWTPACTCYDTAVILGAATGRMEDRLVYLGELWDAGVRFNEVVWLTGERPLDPDTEHLATYCTTESEAAEYMWAHTELPEQMRELPVTFIAVPMQGERRPNTKDTIDAWLEVAPPSFTALVVSSQPFSGYQYAVVNTFLPEAIDFDLVGAPVDVCTLPTPAAVTLDTLARWLWQSNQYVSNP